MPDRRGSPVEKNRLLKVQSERPEEILTSRQCGISITVKARRQECAGLPDGRRQKNKQSVRRTGTVSADMKTRIQELDKLPTISSMQPKLFGLIQNPTSTMAEVVDVVKHDQVMASRIVAMANAPAFGQNGAIRDIEQAVFLLGFDAVKNIALGISLFVMFPLSKSTLKYLWAHSFAVAVMADMIFAKSGKQERGTCFLAGLIHDIGRLALMHLETDRYLSEIIDNKSLKQGSLCQTEERLFTCNHQQAGAWFLEKLALPVEMVAVALSHHVPEEALHSGEMAAATCLAEALVVRCDRNIYGDGSWLDEHQNLATLFKLTPPDLEDMVARYGEERTRMKSFFGV